MQRANPCAYTGSAIEEVIVVEADMLNALLPKNLHHAIRERRLARTAIATDRDNQWLLNPGFPLHTFPLFPAFPCVFIFDRSIGMIARWLFA